MGRLLALVATLLAALTIVWFGDQAPQPAPASAPADSFSADRASADITTIASVPHPIGSPADRAARDALAARMTALGLSPQVRPGVGVWLGRGGADRANVGFVDNLVGVLPGKDPALPALALMAHYDSAVSSPGAADDAIGVASALETVRALKAHGQPARDVMVILTDGEEADLLGAAAFFASDPLARRVGFLINLEARGSKGRVQMFQTGKDNAGTVALLSRLAGRPSASSLTGFIYANMPNDTDFTVSRGAGVAGLNYAIMDGLFDYHSPTSTPAATDRGSLQDMGQQVLAVSTAVAFSPTLPAKAPDLVYGQTPGGLTIAYPAAAGWAVLALAAALLAWSVIQARRANAFPWLDMARGAGAALFAVLSAITVLHFARKVTGVDVGWFEGRFLLAQAGRWEVAVMLTGLGTVLLAIAETARGRRKSVLLPLAAGLACSGIAWSGGHGLDPMGAGLGVGAAIIGALAYGRPVSRTGAWAGVLLLGLVLACVAQALAPAVAFVLAWPVALAALAAALTGLSGRSGVTALAILTVTAALALAFAGSLAHLSFLALDLPELMAMPAIVALFGLWPLAQPDEGAPPARLIGPTLILAGLALTAVVRLSHPYDARHPQATAVIYQIDQDARTAWRVSEMPTLDPWSEGVLRTGGAKPAKLSLWRFYNPVDAAPAPYIDYPGAQMALTKTATGDLTLHVTPPPGARTLTLKLTSNTVAPVVAINGVPVRLQALPGKPAQLSLNAPPAEGFDITLRPAGPGKLEVKYSATLDDWPKAAAPLPKRPANVMPFDISDTTGLTGTRSLSW